MSTLARSNWILALIAAALSALLLVSKPELTDDAPAPFSDLDPADISTISMQLGRPDETELRLKKTSTGWRLVHPVELDADPMAVAEILRLATSRSSRSMDSDSLDLARVQLQPPLWRIQLDQAVFEIGSTEALSGQRYVKHADMVHLVADLNPARLDNNYADLVVRELLPTADTIVSLRLPAAEVGSLDLPAADQNNAALISRWQSAQAQWLVRPNSLDYQDVRARATVFLQDTGGRPYSLDFLIRSRSPRLELIRPDLDLMYMLPGSASEELLGLPDA